MINNHKLCLSAFNRQFTQFTLLLRCQKLKDCNFLEYYAKLFNIAVSDKNLVKLRYQWPFLFDSHFVFWQISLTQGHWRRTKTTKLLHNFQFILCQNQYFLISYILKEVKGNCKVLNVLKWVEFSWKFTLYGNSVKGFLRWILYCFTCFLRNNLFSQTNGVLD